MVFQVFRDPWDLPELGLFGLGGIVAKNSRIRDHLPSSEVGRVRLPDQTAKGSYAKAKIASDGSGKAGSQYGK
jgi:hypothetical protein